MRLNSMLAAACGLLSMGGAANAALIVNAAKPITDRINVNLIAVADSDGSNSTANFLGDTASERNAVFAYIDTIYAQVGVDVEFSFRAGTYNSTFARVGTTGANNPRPNSDLNTIVSQAAAAGGVLSSDPNTINVFMVQIVPGFSQTSDNTSNGLAFVGGNGVTYYGGSNLDDFEAGREVLASVLAHEIGHNLGLPHIVEAENLMQAGGSANQGERLNAAQMATIINSPFTVTIVPEPASVGLLALAGLAAGRRVRRA